MTKIHVATIRFIQSGEITVMLADTDARLLEVVTEFLREIVDCLVDNPSEVPDDYDEMIDYLWSNEHLEVDFVIERLHRSDTEG